MDTPICQKGKLYKDNVLGLVEEALYKSLIGCLMYFIATKPDILYAIGVLPRFLNCTKEPYLKVAKRVLRYVKRTLN